MQTLCSIIVPFFAVVALLFSWALFLPGRAGQVLHKLMNGTAKCLEVFVGGLRLWRKSESELQLK